MLQLPESASRWAIHTIPALPLFASGNIVLIGDAAHAMTPHQGLGAGHAIEDAYVLWRLLSHQSTTKNNLKSVLEIYDKVRRPFAQKTAARSLTNGFMFDFLDPRYEDAPLDVVGRELGASCDWLIDGKGCFEEGDEAMKMLSALNA